MHMTKDADITATLQESVCEATRHGTSLQILGSGSKQFYGRTPRGNLLNLAGHRGITYYEPSELVITARAGTPLHEIETRLAENQQMLAFEPPYFGPEASLGGTIACGLSGPRRAAAGAARDFVLGITCINGKGEVLRYGGQVMKNVAGYDVARLMTGALGTLGVILDVSLKVLPRPPQEITLVQEHNSHTALRYMHDCRHQPWPVSATAYDGERLYVRLSGTSAGLAALQKKLGGETLPDGRDFWKTLREHQQAFFTSDAPLWRLSLPPATSPLSLLGETYIEWNGALRWLKSTEPATLIRQAVSRHGGHAALFRGGDREDTVFHPLTPALSALHRRLKQAFDPAGIFNPGRFYPEI